MTKLSAYRSFKPSSDVVRFAAMPPIRFLLSGHKVKDPLRERGIDIR